MAVFAYQATDSNRSTQVGTIAADTPRQARDLLRQQGLVVRQISEHEAGQRRSGLAVRWRVGSPAKIAACVRELSTLLSAGVPLTDSLSILVRQSRGGFQAALQHLHDRVVAGSALAEAMSEQPAVFDPLTVLMVEVGENSGELETVLCQLAEFKERSLELKDRVTSALVYPAMVLATSIGVTLFLMVYVVPMLLSSLIESGHPLPWPTKILKGASDILVGYGWLMTLAGAGIVAAAGFALRTRRGQRLWCRFILWLPLIGTMAQKQAISRIALILSTLLRSGVAYLEAVEIAARSTKNVLFEDALTESAKGVHAGQEIGPALERTGIFPPLVVHLVTIGQQSGQLESMLARLAIDYDRQVASASTRLASVLEPILILVLAVFVGFILFATLLPILEAGHVL